MPRFNAPAPPAPTRAPRAERKPRWTRGRNGFWRNTAGSAGIIPPEGGPRRAYSSVTTYVKALDDTSKLQEWAMRQVILGLLADPSILERASRVSTPVTSWSGKATLNALAAEAQRAADPNPRSRIGTVLHTASEIVDHPDNDLGGEDLSAETASEYMTLANGAQAEGESIPDAEDHAAALAAYARSVAGLRVVSIEGQCVNDELRVAGTYDRIYDIPDPGMVAPDGTVVVGHVIGDLKTGSSVSWGMGAIAMQLAVYANSLTYDVETDTRGPLPGGPVRRDWAIVLHVPAGGTQATWWWVDIAAAWQVARTTLVETHAHRARKTYGFEGETVVVEVEPAAPEVSISEARALEIAAATRVLDLYTAHSRAQTSGDPWTKDEVELARIRRRQIEETTGK